MQYPREFYIGVGDGLRKQADPAANTGLPGGNPQPAAVQAKPVTTGAQPAPHPTPAPATTPAPQVPAAAPAPTGTPYHPEGRTDQFLHWLMPKKMEGLQHGAELGNQANKYMTNGELDPNKVMPVAKHWMGEQVQKSIGDPLKELWGNVSNGNWGATGDWIGKNPWLAGGVGLLGGAGLYGAGKLMHGMFGGGGGQPQQQQYQPQMYHPQGYYTPQAIEKASAMNFMGKANQMFAPELNIADNMPTPSPTPTLPSQINVHATDPRVRKLLEDPRMRDYLTQLVSNSGR